MRRTLPPTSRAKSRLKSFQSQTSLGPFTEAYASITKGKMHVTEGKMHVRYPTAWINRVVAVFRA